MMTVNSLPTLSSDGIPLRIQLNGLRQLGEQLKVFLGRYNQEPQTQDQFVKREILRSPLRTLEKRCLEQRDFHGKSLRTPDKSSEDFESLIREFRILEFQIKSLMH
jgi:hypothetical protein